MAAFSVCQCGNFVPNKELPEFCNNCGGYKPDPPAQPTEKGDAK